MPKFLRPDLLPTRVLVSLDIRNMFNSVSWERCREILEDRFPRLVPFFDLLYEPDNLCQYIDETGEWGSSPQEEGFAQGCPLSPAFSALVLHEILLQIDRELMIEAKKRLKKGDKGDYGFGSITHLLAFINDTSAVVPYQDVELFCRCFAKLGKPLGAVLNPAKSHILTATDGVSPLPFLPAHLSAPLEAAISKYAAGKQRTDGVRLLGFPVGGRTFAKQFLEKTIKEMSDDVLRITTKLEDLQTMLQVYKVSIVSRFPHLCSADVYHNGDGASSDPFAWSSPFLRSFTGTTRRLLARLTGHSSVPPWVLLIAHLHVGDGGLGILDGATTSVPLFVQSVTSCARYARAGVHLRHRPADTTHELPDELQELYRDPEDTRVKLFRVYKRYARPCFCCTVPRQPRPRPPCPDGGSPTQGFCGHRHNVEGSAAGRRLRGCPLRRPPLPADAAQRVHFDFAGGHEQGRQEHPPQQPHLPHRPASQALPTAVVPQGHPPLPV